MKVVCSFIILIFMLKMRLIIVCKQNLMAMCKTMNTSSTSTDGGLLTASCDFNEGDVLLFNTVTDRQMPSEYTDNYHVHILCNKGEAHFRCNGRAFNIVADDLVIWQMSSKITDAAYSDDFDADFLLVSKSFLGQFNPEMVWAIKGFVFIKLNPAFHLLPAERALCENDFAQFRLRLGNAHLFRSDVIGRLLQIFLFDMWEFYSREIDKMKFGNSTAQLFLRFQTLVGEYCEREREVAFYADKLCITPKYLSEICRKVSDISASEWISYYTRSVIVKMLDDSRLTLAEISDRMRFYNYPHFSRYVKKALGVSPKEYRESMEKER